MKKLLVALLSLGLVFTVAGQAAASFDNGNLVQVVYSATGDEYATDLGSAASFTGTLESPAANVPADLTGYSVAYFGFSESLTGYEFYWATTSDTFLGASGNPNNASAFRSMYTFLDGVDGDNDGETLRSAVGVTSYNYVMNQNGTGAGIYGGWNPALQGEVDAAAHISGDESMYLYKYVFTETYAGLVTGNGTEYIAEIGASQVPVPGAVWMLGSALLGIVGVRRKKN